MIYVLNFIIHACVRPYKFYLKLCLYYSSSDMKTKPILRCMKMLNLTSNIRLFLQLNQ